MRMKILLMIVVFAVMVFSNTVFAAFSWPTQQHFPSAKMGYYMLNGYPAAEGKDAYFTWFANNYDFVANVIDYNARPDPYTSPVRDEILAFLKSVNPNIRGTIYNWFHSIAPWKGLVNWHVNNALLQYTFDNNIDPEDWFMHFKKNTAIGRSWTSATFDNDISDEEKFHYVYVDSTKITDNAWRTSDTETFGQNTGSILYLGHNFKFKEINFVFSTPASADWQGIWEYWNGASWSSLTITSDTTNDLTQNGKIEFWQPPADWKRVGNINNEKPVYWVRLKTINTGTTKPVAQTIKGQKYLVNVDVSGTNRVVFPGWDPAQDQGQNGRVANDGVRDTLPDDISNLSGTSALIKAHSRPVTTSYLAFSTNLNNAAFRPWIADSFVAELGPNTDGFYYDSIDATGADQYFGFPLGGVNDNIVLEYPTNAIGTWRDNIVQMMLYSKTNLESTNRILDGNTVRQAANLEIERAEHLALRESVYGLFGHKSSYDLEQSSYWKILTNDSFYRIVGKEGIRNILNFVYSFNWKYDPQYDNISTDLALDLTASEINAVSAASTAIFPDSGYLWIDQEKIRYTGKTANTFTGLSRGVDGTVATSHDADFAGVRVVPQESNDREKIYMLSLFYIVQNPATDYFFPWKECCQRWYYTNTLAEARAFFVNAVKYDIGQPTGNIPTGYSALPNNDWQVFVLYQGSDFKIYARDYTKAITLAKPLSTAGFGEASRTTITLPVTTDNPSGKYYQLMENASLNLTPITSIGLRSIEGAILIKESAMNLTSCSAQSGFYCRAGQICNGNWILANDTNYCCLGTCVDDTTPPVISNTQATSITQTSATITWTTNETSNSTVDYGTTTALGSKRSDTNLVTSHSVSLTGLANSTKYYYRATSCDVSGNCANSSLQNFTTTVTTQTCSDGTLYGQCSSTKPKYCQNGTLIDKCTACGCPSGQSCNTTSQSCYTPICTENWQCTSWSACSGGTQARTCTDMNNCSTMLNKPPESQSCIAGNYSKLTIRGRIRKNTMPLQYCDNCKITITFVDSANTANTATAFNYTSSNGNFTIILNPLGKFSSGYHTLNMVIEKNSTRASLQRRIYVR